MQSAAIRPRSVKFERRVFLKTRLLREDRFWAGIDRAALVWYYNASARCLRVANNPEKPQSKALVARATSRPAEASATAAAAMAAAQQKAKDLMAKGEKCLTKFSFFGGGTAKFEDAAECFQDAGKMFIMAKAFDEAGNAYLRAAEMHEKTQSDFDTGSTLTRAGEAFQKANDLTQCAAAYRRAADVFAGAGKGNMAANASKKLAELIEADDDEDRLPEAVEAYQQAVDFYDAENQPRRADGCREKVAVISARLGAYDDAIAQFDALGRSSLQSNLGKFNAKKWFTYSILCCLAREDLVKAQKLLGEYASLDYTLVGTREHDLLEALCQAVESNDEEAIATAAAEYDRVKRLDPWTTKLLLAVKGSCATVDIPHVVEAAAGLTLADEDELPDLT